MLVTSGVTGSRWGRVSDDSSSAHRRQMDRGAMTSSSGESDLGYSATAGENARAVHAHCVMGRSRPAAAAFLHRWG
jgi:hypothetical protein